MAYQHLFAIMTPVGDSHVLPAFTFRTSVAQGEKHILPGLYTIVGENDNCSILSAGGSQERILKTLCFLLGIVIWFLFGSRMVLPLGFVQVAAHFVGLSLSKKKPCESESAEVEKGGKTAAFSKRSQQISIEWKV